MSGFLSGNSPVLAKDEFHDSREAAADVAAKRTPGKQVVVAEIVGNTTTIYEASRAGDEWIFTSWPDLSKSFNR